jgi:hypothetical protein
LFAIDEREAMGNRHNSAKTARQEAILTGLAAYFRSSKLAEGKQKANTPTVP